MVGVLTIIYAALMKSLRDSERAVMDFDDEGS